MLHSFPHFTFQRSFLLSSRCACTSCYLYCFNRRLTILSHLVLCFRHKFAQFYTWIHSVSFLLLQLPVCSDEGKKELDNRAKGTAGSFRANPVREDRRTHPRTEDHVRSRPHSGFEWAWWTAARRLRIKSSLCALWLSLLLFLVLPRVVPVVLYNGTCVLVKRK